MLANKGLQLKPDPLGGAKGAKAMEPAEIDRLLASIQHGGGRKSLAKLISLGQAALPGRSCQRGARRVQRPA